MHVRLRQRIKSLFLLVISISRLMAGERNTKSLLTNLGNLLSQEKCRLRKPIRLAMNWQNVFFRESMPSLLRHIQIGSIFSMVYVKEEVHRPPHTALPSPLRAPKSSHDGGRTSAIMTAFL